MKILKKLLKKLRINIQRVTFDGLGLTVLLSILLAILVTSTFRVIKNGQDNYNIYKTEQGSLERLQNTNKQLTKELEIVSSDEYQKLLAREVLGIAEQNESIYRIDEPEDFFILEKEYVDLSDKDDYLDWWFSLIR